MTCLRKTRHLCWIVNTCRYFIPAEDEEGTACWQDIHHCPILRELIPEESSVLTREVTSLQESLDEERSEKSDLEDENARLSMEVRKLETQIQSLEKAENFSTSRIEELEDQVEALKDAIHKF